jgi:hypothetical protein
LSAVGRSEGSGNSELVSHGEFETAPRTRLPNFVVEEMKAAQLRNECGLTKVACERAHDDLLSGFVIGYANAHLVPGRTLLVTAIF